MLVDNILFNIIINIIIIIVIIKEWIGTNVTWARLSILLFIIFLNCLT